MAGPVSLTQPGMGESMSQVAWQGLAQTELQVAMASSRCAHACLAAEVVLFQPHTAAAAVCVKGGMYICKDAPLVTCSVVAVCVFQTSP
jgi:hypothetical protein